MIKTSAIAAISLLPALLTAIPFAAAQSPGMPGTFPPPGTGEQQNWITVERRAVGGAASVGGTVVPLQEITFTAQMPGNVEKIAGDEGDYFKAGTVLAAMDEAALRAKREAAVAQIRNAEAAVRNAGVQWQRELEDPSPKQGNMWSQMMPMPMPFMGDSNNGVHRGATLHNYTTQMEQARGQLATAHAGLREIDAKLQDTKSVAPFDGYITRKHVNKGDTVQPGQPLLSFANMNQLQIQTDVPTRLSATLHPGFITQVRLDDPGQTIVRARVAQVFPMADPTRHTVRVKFDLEPGSPAKAGMYGEVLIPQSGERQSSLPMIPVSAVVYRGGLPMVYVLDADNQPRLHLLRLGEQYGESVTVLTGLEGGERVLANP
jgi:multidrug efflux pump subunit AcrA (membrane-fusion protein)